MVTSWASSYGGGYVKPLMKLRACASAAAANCRKVSAAAANETAVGESLVTSVRHVALYLRSTQGAGMTDAKFVTFLVNGEIRHEQVVSILEPYGRVEVWEGGAAWLYDGGEWVLQTQRIAEGIDVVLERGVLDGLPAWRLKLERRADDIGGVLADIQSETEYRRLAVIERIEADLDRLGFEPQRYEGTNTPGEAWSDPQHWPWL